MRRLFSKLLRCKHPRRRLLVCFTGLDGSGKTSHAKSLCNYLSDRGCACHYAWAGTTPILSYFFYGFTWLLGYWKRKVSNGEYSIDPLGQAPENIREKALNSVWRFFLVVDFQIKCLMKIRLPLLLGKTVITDRYVYDLMVGLMTKGMLPLNFVKFLLQAVPTPHLTFFLDASEGVLSVRRGIPIDVAHKKRAEYLLLAAALDFSVLNTSNDFTRNQQEVRKSTLLLSEEVRRK